MPTFVLVAGGWHGGWAFSPFARDLRRQGVDVFTPTLTGLGERAHLARLGPNLDTHIEDVANVLLYEDLTDVVLCGHSYAGMVITGVADRLAERIRALVYLDAFVPADGDSWWSLAGDGYRRLAIERSGTDGLAVTPPERLDRRSVPHPLASFRQVIRLTGRWREVPRKVFVYASQWQGTPFTATYEALKQDPSWTVHTLATGHDLVEEAPQVILAILCRAAGSPLPPP
jgi:pimeloyl-ACP methyl ester carboxylesterase